MTSTFKIQFVIGKLRPVSLDRYFEGARYYNWVELASGVFELLTAQKVIIKLESRERKTTFRWSISYSKSPNALN